MAKGGSNMKKYSTAIAACLCISGMICFSCLSPDDTSPNDTIVAGEWEGFITPINYQSLNFNGANIFINFSSKEPTFILVARDTTEIVSQEIKDTILVLEGAWELNATQDSVLLTPSSCRALDTTTRTLASRSAQDQSIRIPKLITKNEASVIWEICFIDLESLVPLLGLNISEDQKGLLQMLTLDLEKKL